MKLGGVMHCGHSVMDLDHFYSFSSKTEWMAQVSHLLTLWTKPCLLIKVVVCVSEVTHFLQYEHQCIRCYIETKHCVCQCLLWAPNSARKCVCVRVCDGPTVHISNRGLKYSNMDHVRVYSWVEKLSRTREIWALKAHIKYSFSSPWDLYQ